MTILYWDELKELIAALRMESWILKQPFTERKPKFSIEFVGGYYEAVWAYIRNLEQFLVPLEQLDVSPQDTILCLNNRY